MECEYQWEKELIPDSHNITICGKVKYVLSVRLLQKQKLKISMGKKALCLTFTIL